MFFIQKFNNEIFCVAKGHDFCHFLTYDVGVFLPKAFKTQKSYYEYTS